MCQFDVDKELDELYNEINKWYEYLSMSMDEIDKEFNRLAKEIKKIKYKFPMGPIILLWR